MADNHAEAAANSQNDLAVVQPAPIAAPDPAIPATRRLASVDALRGFDMFWIIGGDRLLLAFLALFFTPVPEAIEHQLDHVPWEGFVAWDLIMPLFLFVSGAALPFSFSKWAGTSGGERRALYLRLARRLLLLWVLGIAVQGNLFAWDLEKLALYSNTLQAIAAGYLVSAIFLLTLSLRGQIVATVALLIAYWALLTFVPVPGQPAGVLEEWNNLALYVDETILGEFRDGTTYTWTLSSLGFAATVMQGVFAGHLLRSRASESRKTLGLLALAFGNLAAGWVWGLWHPIIKHIWTSSMVLWAGGWCYLLLAAFYYVIDVRGHRKWAFPLIVIGMNAIFIYTATHLINFHAISERFFKNLAQYSPALAEFLTAAGAVLLAWGILLYMYRKKTFIRL